MSSLAMTKSEREAFLAETHVAVISVVDGSRGPLTVPVWYSYASGHDVRFVTGGGSRKAKLLRAAGRLGLCVQTETPPYKYVSIEGRVVVGEPIDFERDVREIAVRYLGREMGEAYLQMTADDRAPGNNVLVRLTPERWFSVDYTKMG
jgi:PPOX class probable F420-dependent enzyme